MGRWDQKDLSAPPNLRVPKRPLDQSSLTDQKDQSGLAAPQVQKVQKVQLDQLDQRDPMVLTHPWHP